MYEGSSKGLTVGFSSETIKDRSQWNGVSKVMKEKQLSSKILYPVKAFFKNE